MQWNSVDDKKIGSAWIGCDALKDGRECSYWVRACCLGFGNAREADFAKITFYCPEHNDHTKLIEQLTEKSTLKKKETK